MLRIRTRLAISSIHGIGLFACESIAEGTLIWEYDPHFDVTFTSADLADLAPPAREQVEKYSYFEALVAAFVLCGDDARFMNHSFTPNTRDLSRARTVARRDVMAGEELTCNYLDLAANEPPGG